MPNIHEMFTKRCSRCKQTKSFTAFGLSSWRKDGQRNECKQCESACQKTARRTNPNQRTTDRKFNLRHGFGMTVEEYDALWRSQNGGCAICKQPETAKHQNGVVKHLAIDHCHETDVKRGLLCGRCNVAIGYFRDSIELLEAAIGYLQQHQHPTEKANAA